MDVDFNAVRMAAWGLSREFSPVGPGKVAAAAEVFMEVWEEQGLPGLSLLDYDRVSNFLRGLIAGFVFEWNTTRVAPDGRPPSPVSTGLGFDSPPHAVDRDALSDEVQIQVELNEAVRIPEDYGAEQLALDIPCDGGACFV